MQTFLIAACTALGLQLGAPPNSDTIVVESRSATSGDPNRPIIIGSLFNGADRPTKLELSVSAAVPESLRGWVHVAGQHARPVRRDLLIYGPDGAALLARGAAVEAIVIPMVDRRTRPRPWRLRLLVKPGEITAATPAARRPATATKPKFVIHSFDVKVESGTLPHVERIGSFEFRPRDGKRTKVTLRFAGGKRAAAAIRRKLGSGRAMELRFADRSGRRTVTVQLGATRVDNLSTRADGTVEVEVSGKEISLKTKSHFTTTTGDEAR